MDATADNLFDRKRIVWKWHLIPVFFYFPIGLFLATVRFFLGLHTLLASYILLKFPHLQNLILRVMCSVLGFVVIQTCTHNHKPEKAYVVIANHVTNFDHLAVNLVKKCTVPSVWDLPHFLNWILGYSDFGVKQGRQVLIKNVKNFVKSTESPVLIFPEGATTNGKVGMLKFSLWPFSMDEPIQPLAIKVLQPPFIKISSSVLGSRWWSDLFWFLFVPYTIFLIKYLPVVQKRPKESTEDFSFRIQSLLCQELKLKATNVTSYDKVEYAKQFLNQKL